MQRLPDRFSNKDYIDPEFMARSTPEGRDAARKKAQINKETGKQKTQKEKFRDAIATYGPILILVVVLFMFTASEPVPVDKMTITDVTVLEGQEDDGIYVAGFLEEEGSRYRGFNVSFNEANGVAEVEILKYQVPTIFGGRDFVALIGEDPAEVKEIWLVYDDQQGNVEKEQLEWPKE